MFGTMGKASNVFIYSSPTDSVHVSQNTVGHPGAETALATVSTVLEEPSAFKKVQWKNRGTTDEAVALTRQFGFEKTKQM